MAENEAPRSYRDPLYAELAAQVEAKEGLPAGLLSSVINYGERSNADQVSGKGARTVAQIIPATRKAALDKFGIDAYLSPQNALTVAGKLLRESLDRNGGDPAAAVSEYHGGTNRENWGPVTQAYRDRVMSGLQATKTKILSGDFGKWLEANPATPAPAAPAAGTPTGPSPLDAGFAQWLQAQPAPGAAQTSAVDQIPGQNGPVPPQPTPNPEPHTLAEKLAAAGKLTLQTLSNPVQAVKDATEMVASVGTGLTTGAAGMLSGTVQGMVENAVNGQAGTPEAAANVERRASQGADALTYKPQSPAAQEAVQTVGRGMQDAGLPLAGISGELATLARGAASAAPAVQATTRAGASAASEAATAAATATAKAAQAVRDKAVSMTSETTRKLIGLPDLPKESDMVGVGAAETEAAAQRRATAGNLKVPIDLSAGEATRRQDLLQFEGETAKDARLGQPLREHNAEQNARLAKNLDVLADETGAQAPNQLEAGRYVVDKALKPLKQQYETKYKVLYKEADKAGEMVEPVSTAPLVQYLKDNASFNSPELAGGTMGLLQRELERLGKINSDASGPGVSWTDFVGQRMGPYMKSEGGHAQAMARISQEWKAEQGGGAAQVLSLRDMELLRQQIGKAMESAPANKTNIKAGVEIDKIIDQATEGLGGDKYKEARAAYRRYAQLFQQNSVVSDLLRTKPGTADRAVALEDVFRRTILNGSREDLSMLRRTLQVGNDEAGHQAWRELQGATLRHLLDEATKNVSTDIRGNPVFSAAGLNKAIRALDVDGRLDFILGKQRAQMVRDINEVAKWVTTFPPGTVNTSNTAAILLAAIAEAGATGGLTGVPLPVLSTIRLGTKYVRDRAIRQRVLAALGKAETSAKKVKAPKSVVPKPGDAGRMPESRTVH